MKKDTENAIVIITLVVMVLVLFIALLGTNLTQLGEFDGKYHEKDVIELGGRLCKFEFGEEYTFCGWEDIRETRRTTDKIICCKEPPKEQEFIIKIGE